MKLSNKQRIMTLILIVILLLLVGAFIVEASAWGTTKQSVSNSWHKAKPYLKLKPIINYAILAIVFIFASQFIPQVKDMSSKWVVYVLCIILGIIITINLVPLDKYVWETNIIEASRAYTVGASETAVIPGTSTLMKCGDEGQYRSPDGNCERQAILRTNKTFGLPTFIIGFIILILLFKSEAIKETLGLGGKNKTTYILAGILAATMANSMTKYTDVIWIGKIVLTITFYYTFKKTMGKEQGSSLWPIAVAVTLVFSIGDLIETAFTDDIWSMSDIYWNFIYGMLAGWIHNQIWGKQGAIKNYLDKSRKKYQKTFDNLVDEGEVGKALKQSIPLIGRWWLYPKYVTEVKARIEQLKESKGKWKQLETTDTIILDKIEKADQELHNIEADLNTNTLLSGERIPDNVDEFNDLVAVKLRNRNRDVNEETIAQVTQALILVWEEQKRQDAIVQDDIKKLRDSIALDEKDKTRRRRLRWPFYQGYDDEEYYEEDYEE